jgi:hypothetical protein
MKLELSFPHTQKTKKYFQEHTFINGNKIPIKPHNQKVVTRYFFKKRHLPGFRGITTIFSRQCFP